MDAEARPTLDRPAIVEAALRLLDKAGLDELSTRRLAGELNVKGPSLYWHFRNMAELRDHMAEALLAAELPPPDSDPSPDDWRDWMAAGARGIRRAAHSRRDGARLLMGWRPTPERRMRVFPANRARLMGAGFMEEDARVAFFALARYALGWALAEQSTDGATPQSEADFESGLAAMLDGLALRRR
jgi:TetR/AcrR family transcriptional regulator, tetracycline repressor protein